MKCHGLENSPRCLDGSEFRRGYHSSCLVRFVRAVPALRHSTSGGFRGARSRWHLCTLFVRVLPQVWFKTSVARRIMGRNAVCELWTSDDALWAEAAGSAPTRVIRSGELWTVDDAEWARLSGCARRDVTMEWTREWGAVLAGLSRIEVDSCLTRTWCGDEKAWAHLGRVATADAGECNSAVGVVRHEGWGPDEHLWACSGSSGRRSERRQAAVRHRHAMADVHRAQRGALVGWADVGRPRRGVPRAGMPRARCRDCCSPYVRARRVGRPRISLHKSLHKSIHKSLHESLHKSLHESLHNSLEENVSKRPGAPF